MRWQLHSRLPIPDYRGGGGMTSVVAIMTRLICKYQAGLDLTTSWTLPVSTAYAKFTKAIVFGCMVLEFWSACFSLKEIVVAMVVCYILVTVPKGVLAFDDVSKRSATLCNRPIRLAPWPDSKSEYLLQTIAYSFSFLRYWPLDTALL